MTDPEKNQLQMIEASFRAGVSDRKQAKQLGLSIGGFYMRWVSLHKKRITDNA